MNKSINHFKQSRQAVCTELDGKVALFHIETCEYLILNETGSAIWNALESNPTLSELCTQLQDTYDVNADECMASVEAWLETGIAKQVVTISQETAIKIDKLCEHVPNGRLILKINADNNFHSF